MTPPRVVVDSPVMEPTDCPLCDAFCEGPSGLLVHFTNLNPESDSPLCCLPTAIYCPRCGWRIEGARVHRAILATMKAPDEVPGRQEIRR